MSDLKPGDILRLRIVQDTKPDGDCEKCYFFSEFDYCGEPIDCGYVCMKIDDCIHFELIEEKE